MLLSLLEPADVERYSNTDTQSIPADYSHLIKHISGSVMPTPPDSEPFLWQLLQQQQDSGSEDVILPTVQDLQAIFTDNPIVVPDFEASVVFGSPTKIPPIRLKLRMQPSISPSAELEEGELPASAGTAKRRRRESESPRKSPTKSAKIILPSAALQEAKKRGYGGG